VSAAALTVVLNAPSAAGVTRASGGFWCVLSQTSTFKKPGARPRTVTVP